MPACLRPLRLRGSFPMLRHFLCCPMGVTGGGDWEGSRRPRRAAVGLRASPVLGGPWWNGGSFMSSVGTALPVVTGPPVALAASEAVAAPPGRRGTGAPPPGLLPRRRCPQPTHDFADLIRPLSRGRGRGLAGERAAIQSGRARPCSSPTGSCMASSLGGTVPPELQFAIVREPAARAPSSVTSSCRRSHRWGIAFPSPARESRHVPFRPLTNRSMRHGAAVCGNCA